MASFDSTMTIKLDEDALAVLLRLIAALDQLTAVMERAKSEKPPRDPGPYLAGA